MARIERVSGFAFGVLVSSISLAGIGSLQAQDSVAVDSALIRELERELAGDDTPSAQPARTSRPTTNPDISVIGDFRSWYESEAERSFDVELSEVETSLRAAVDPYARADVYIAVANEDGEYVFELEEAYFTTLSLPYRLQAKAGKFRSNFGKINQIHPHALPYPDIPAMYRNFLGDEGLNDEGVSINWLVPNQTFYQELTFEFTRGPSENPSFERSDKNRFLYLGHLDNFWDLTQNATLELGLTGAAGPNDVGRTTVLGGLDLTYKWKPLQKNTYRSFTAMVEGLVSRRNTGRNGGITSFGLYAMLQYQLSMRWHLIGRYDHSDLPDDPDWNEHGIAVYLGWYATEFQKIELGVKTTSGAKIDRNWIALARLVFVIGTHGAHQY